MQHTFNSLTQTNTVQKENEFVQFQSSNAEQFISSLFHSLKSFSWWICLQGFVCMCIGYAVLLSMNVCCVLCTVLPDLYLPPSFSLCLRCFVSFYLLLLLLLTFSLTFSYVSFCVLSVCLFCFVRLPFLLSCALLFLSLCVNSTYTHAARFILYCSPL